MNEKEQLEPIVFSITDQNDLQIIKEFEVKHYLSCRKRFSDFTGALFKYTVIPTGLGTLYVLSCPCGESIDLYGDMA